MTYENEAAKDLWAQMFRRAIEVPNATIHNPEYQSEEEREVTIFDALKKAGWGDDEIKDRIAFMRDLEAKPNVNSPGVGPGLEAMLRYILNEISKCLSPEELNAYYQIEAAIEPVTGISASVINVIMTDQAILTVSSFLFRWCGLIARAYTRTITSDLHYWAGSFSSTEEDGLHLAKACDLSRYWIHIFISFSKTGTHALVPYQPCTPKEVVLMEQVAWSMEYFAISHECGHKILNHRSVEADKIQQEYDADRFALRICSQLKLEPFDFENPYLRTGAGFTLLLKSLEILRLCRENFIHVPQPNTHPSADSRINQIINRNILQPSQFTMDSEFNNVVVRIMNAVSWMLKRLY